jgi:DNA-binding NarL/FixJ family response regulator
MRTEIKTLLVEDEVEQQQELIDLLKLDGVEVIDVASTIDEARQKIERYWESVDVIILDNKLGDPHITGPQVVIEIRARKENSRSPEFIVYTDWDDIAYYRYSLDIGVAQYMIKGSGNPIVHVKVLALRRALSLKNPEIRSEVDRIAVYSKNISDALLTFCQRVLESAFDSYLGVPFVILFTEGNETRNCATNSEMLTAGVSPLYHTLQALAHGKGNPTEPFVLETSKLAPPTEQEAALYKRLNGAAFLPIPLSNEMKLSIGILRTEARAEESESKQEKELCTVLAQHLRPTVLENIISLWSLLTEFRVARNSTARLCLRVGQEINDGLAADELDQLEDLANDLNSTGQYLTKLDSHAWYDGEDVSIREVVQKRWELISMAEDYSAMRLDLQGDCVVRAQRNDIVVVISRLLQWFAYRCQATPPGIEPMIKVECETTGGQANITSEDNSYRLPPPLRRDLFEPFTQAIATPFPNIEVNESATPQTVAEKQTLGNVNAGRFLPLYLAKMLVEGRYHGLLVDRSDEIKGHPYGHRILLQLPSVNKRE